MEGKDVAVIGKSEIGEPITKELILSYMDSFGIGSKLNENEKTQFINVAVAYRLNPFKREIYCNPYNTKDGRKLSIITGYEVYLKRAERIGDLDGWKVTTTGSIKDGNLKAQIVIHRKSWTNPFEHEVEFSEYNLGQSVWLSKPITMIKKVVTAQGFRMAFPDELGGMPYTADELPVEMVSVVSSTPKAPPAGPQAAKKVDKSPTPTHTPTSVENKIATGFIMDITEPNAGGYVSVCIEGCTRPDGKPRKFSTKDEAAIDTILDLRDAGEKLSIEYTENPNPHFADTITKVISESKKGDAQE